jgi:TldD protein
LRSVKRVTFAECWIHAWRQRKCYVDTEGSDVEQEFTGIHFGVRATAIRGNDLQTRTYPAFHGHGRHRGLELLDEFDPLGQCERVGDEAVMLLDAQPCPGTTTDLVLLPPAVCSLVHESLGHPTELDRVLGSEANFAGTSHLTQEKLGKFRFGSDLVTIVADATIPGGMGSFWFDDEGVSGQRVELVRNGVFVGYQSSRESSLVLGQTSNGTMRAQRWCHMPLVRMTNINLEPAQGSLDDMLAETDGYVLDGFKSVSIDDRRLNFSLGTEIGWRIKKGKKLEMIRNPVVSGISTDYWRSVDFVGGRQSWILYGIPSCGKGEPHQIMRVGHGAPPVRFRQVKLGN